MPPGIIQGRKGRTMKKIDITIDNKLFTFICTWHNTRTGFAHDVTLFINNSEVTRSHCYYMNRTWETWSYQTACIAAINNLITWLSENITEGYKSTYNYKRLTAARRTMCDELINDNPTMKTYKTCKQLLLDNLY